MADGGQLFNALGGGMNGASADAVSQFVGVDVQSYMEPMFVVGVMASLSVLQDTPSTDRTLTVLQDTASAADSLIALFSVLSTFSRGFPVAVTAESPTLSTSGVSLSLDGSTTLEYAVLPLENTIDGFVFNYAGAGFGVEAAPTLYKMRGYQTVANAFEYWTSFGTPSLTNPSGQALTAGSITVVAVKRQVQLV